MASQFQLRLCLIKIQLYKGTGSAGKVNILCILFTFYFMEGFAPSEARGSILLLLPMCVFWVALAVQLKHTSYIIRGTLLYGIAVLCVPWCSVAMHSVSCGLTKALPLCVVFHYMLCVFSCGGKL